MTRIGLQHRAVHAQPPRPQQRALDRHLQRFAVELVDQLGPQPPGQLHQRRGVGHAPIQRDRQKRRQASESATTLHSVS
jgi:hypothetical protein